MAKSKKNKVSLVPETIFRFNDGPEPITTLRLSSSEKIEDCEWCFQFDDDEPTVFARGNRDNDGAYVQFKLTATKDSNITFHDTTLNKHFKLFVRKKT